MATLTVQDSPEAGGVTMAAAASGGDVFPNDGKTLLVVLNVHASLSRTVTVTAQDTTATVPGFGACTKADAVQAVETATLDVMGPFPTTAFNNSSAQAVVTYSDSADSLTVAAVRISGAT